jgi:hypothetical protein
MRTRVLLRTQGFARPASADEFLFRGKQIQLFSIWLNNPSNNGLAILDITASQVISHA